LKGIIMNGALKARFVSALLGGTALAGFSAPVLAADAATTLETVTVTAERRTENILDVPYNISAVGGDTLANNHVLDSAELMRSIPGVSVVDRGDRNASTVNGIRIRGLNVDSSALGDYSVSAAATVSTYVNDTPLFANFLLTDISRVEVLKGPQGTLYGSGALGGTVRYILNKPELGVFSASLGASVSNVEGSGSVGLSGTGIVNIPLGDTLALRITATRNQFPGVTDYTNLYVLDSTGAPAAPSGVLSNDASYTVKKDADFAHQTYARAALLWKPSASFDATATFAIQSDDFGGRRGMSLGTDGFGVPYKDSQIGSAQLEPATRDVYLGALEANLDLGFATLTSSTSYYNHHGEITSENTGFYAQNEWLHDFYYNYPRPLATADRHYGDKAFIEEVRLVSESGGPFDYIIGLYYQNQQLLSTQDSYLKGFKRWWDAAYPAFAAAVISDQDYLYRHNEEFTEKAVYGNLTYHFTDALQVTGGFRYFEDRSSAVVHQETGLYSSIFDSSTSSGVVTGSKILFKGNASWKFNDDALLYATVSQGYRRGGTNATPTTGYFAESAAWLTYKPDTNVNYEIGVKGRWNDITYNIDAFYVDWKNPQFNTATTFWGFFAVQNAPSATSKGVEAQIDGYAGDNLHYGLGYTFTDATLGADLYSADGFSFINSKGAQLPGAPRHVVTAALDYTTPTLFDISTTFHLDGYYQSSMYNSLSCSTCALNFVPPIINGVPAYNGQPKFFAHLPGYMLWNVSARMEFDANWDASLWVKNVFDAHAVSGVYTDAYMGTSPGQNYYGNGSKALTALPRTVGITLNYKM
jgi:outer membrane receptor protein involved in Fe transport